MVRRATFVLLVCCALLALPALPGLAEQPSSSQKPSAPRSVLQVPEPALDGPFGAATEASAPRSAVGSRFAIFRTDGNDTRGPLDLATMRIKRGRTKDTIKFTTRGPVPSAALDPSNGNFAVLFDINDNERYDFAQYVFFAAGRIRGILVNLHTDRVVDRTVPTSRLSGRAFRTMVLRSKIDSPGTYRFALFGFYQSSPCSRRRPCIDAIPNRFPLIALDHRAPSVADLEVETFSTDASFGGVLTFPVTLDVEDDRYGTGVKRWTIERRLVGSGSPWEIVGTWRFSGSAAIDVPGVEGATYEVRVAALDKQKNKELSAPHRSSLPFDDRNADVTFSGTPVEEFSDDAFLETITRIAQHETATFTFPTGSTACLVGGPSGALSSSDLTLDGVNAGSATERPTTSARKRVACLAVATSGPHTLVVETTSAEPFVIDGFYAIP